MEVSLLALPVSVTSICIPGEEESDSKIVLFSLSATDSSEGDAIRRLLGFPESESDALPSDSSWLRYAKRLLPDLPDSEPESSLFPSMPEDVIPRLLLDLEESDSYSLPSESSWPLTTLD